MARGCAMKKVVRSAWEEDYYEDDFEASVYNQEARERMVEEGVIEAWEAAFLDGALEDWDPAS